MVDSKKVKIEGDLVFTAPSARQQIKEASSESKFVELDFHDVDLMDSVGISMIVKLYKELKRKGGELRIVNVRKHLWELFDICGISTLIKIDISDKM